MSKNNRQNRAAKQRQRRRAGRGFRTQRPGPGWDEDSAALADALATALLVAGEQHASGDTDAARECVQQVTGPQGPFGVAAVAQVIRSVLVRMVEAVVVAGWQPVDLHQITLRRLSPAHLPLLVPIVAAQAAAHPAGTVHPRWRAQVADLGGPPVPATGDLLAGGRSSGADELATLTRAVELTGMLGRLPELAQVLPPPGRFTGAAPEVTEGEAKLLARVRALLSKAESTEYAEEAEALSAKAQDLMTRHSLQALVAQRTSAGSDPVSAARLWIDAPYAVAKSLLVQAVAEANRGRAVWSEALGCLTIFGRESDLVAVELLSTSLLVQATRAMVGGQPATGRRTRSYRQSFLVAFAERIGERLRGAADTATQDLARHHGAQLLPVLSGASQRVEDAVSAAFPHLVHRSVSVSSAVGWAAGRAAADLALLDVRGQVTGTAAPDLADTA